jgi:hypothetical protein
MFTLAIVPMISELRLPTGLTLTSHQGAGAALYLGTDLENRERERPVGLVHDQ